MSDAFQQIASLPTDVMQQAVDQPADVGSQIMAPAKKAKKPPKWACSRIYFEGKPARPTAVKLWCNGGKTLVKLPTKGMKPGVPVLGKKPSSTYVRFFKVAKGKYHNFTVAFRKQVYGRKGELRVFYNYGERAAGVIRNPWLDTPEQSRVLT